jgi:Protein of unknown function (DUF2934)
MAIRKTSKGRSHQKQALGATETAAAVLPNGESENPSGVMNGGSPSFEQIQRRAYELFVARGGTDGCDLADWFTAEQQLLAPPIAGH